MKALIYKEFKLAMHPICYIFILFFPFLIFAPSYPIGIDFIYILSTYPILFLGANKGQQSNDLLYTALLPVGKKEIVKARTITVVIIELAFTLLMTILYPFASKVVGSLNASVSEEGLVDTLSAGIPLSGYFFCVGLALVCLSISDIIYFALYYRNGKSIVAPTLLSLLTFVVLITLLTIVPVYIPPFDAIYASICENISVQLAILGGCLLVYGILHFVTYKISSNLLEKVDF